MTYIPPNPNGQTTAANSSPVVLASDQSSVPAVGNIAHDAVDSGNPLKIGGKVSTSTPTIVSHADRVDAWLDEYGRQVVTDRDPETGQSQGTTSLRDRLVAQRYTILSDSVADGLASFWTQSTAAGGTITVTGGEGLLQTSAAAGGKAQLSSTILRYYPGQVTWLNSAFRFSAGITGNTRRLGSFTVSGYTPQDGFYFELADSTLSAVVIKSGVVQSTTVSTSWSRATQAPFTLDTNYHSFELRYTANSVNFLVDNVVRHTYAGTTTAITNTLDFPITMQNVNTSNATNVVLGIRNIGLGRFGTPENQGVLNSSPTTTPVSAGVTASGDTTVIAATTGKQIKLFWYHLQAKGTNSANVTAIVKGTIGGVSTAINTADYIANQAFAHTVGSGNRSIIFDSNTPVVVNLSTAQPVWFNAEYDLI